MSNANLIFKVLHKQKLTSSPIINEELAKILSHLLWDYIGIWYSTISIDEELYAELGEALKALSQEIERRLARIDWVGLLTNDVPKVILSHIRDYKSCCDKAGTAYSGGLSFEELFYGFQPHIALKTPENEGIYLRKVAKVLIDTLILESELQSDSVRMLLREVVANSVLALLVENLSDPAYINELLLLGLNEELIDSINEKYQREGAYSEVSEISDMSQFTDNELDLPTVTHMPVVTDEPEITLFKVPNKKSFNKKKKTKERDGFAQGLNKITFGGLERFNNGIDRLKDFVIPGLNPDKLSSERKKKNRKDNYKAEFNTNSESESEQTEGYIATTSGSSNLLKTDSLIQNRIIEEFDKESGSQLRLRGSAGQNNSGVECNSNLSDPNLIKNSTKVTFDTLPQPEITIPVPEPKSCMQKIESRFKAIILMSKQVIGFLWNLQLETRKGPKRLGVINTELYERNRLEDNFILLFEEIFDLYDDRHWVYVQLHYFIRPMLNRLMGHIINRAVMKGVYSVICEDSVRFYCEKFREAFWPNGIPSPAAPLRSDIEKELLYKGALEALLEVTSRNLELTIEIPPIIVTKEDGSERTKFLLDVFQNRKLNKHLLFILLDLILTHLLPETLSMRPGD